MANPLEVLLGIIDETIGNWESDSRIPSVNESLITDFNAIAGDMGRVTIDFLMAIEKELNRLEKNGQQRTALGKTTASKSGE